MTPFPNQPPPVQQARYGFTPPAQPRASATVTHELRQEGSLPSRIDQRPTTIDRWGHLAGLGADTERIQVQQPEAESSIAPIVCAALGFLVVGALRR